MSKTPFRPTHTGSARVQALREANRRSHKPTHVRLPQAAVAVEPEESVSTPATGPSIQVRHARHPLPLGQGRLALAVRRRGDKPLEVLLQDAQGHRRWLPLLTTVPPVRWEEWARHGFPTQKAEGKPSRRLPKEGAGG